MDELQAIEKLLLPAVGALSAVVVFLWKQVVDRFKETKADLTKCEDQHAETTNTLMDVKEELGELRGRQQGVEDLAKQVLEVVRDGSR